MAALMFSILVTGLRFLFGLSSYTKDGTGMQYSQDAAVFGLTTFALTRFGGTAFAENQKIVIFRNRFDVFVLAVAPGIFQALYWIYRPGIHLNDLLIFMAINIPLYYFAASLMVWDRSKPVGKALVSLLVNGMAYAIFVYTSGAAMGFCFYCFFLGQKAFASGRWDGGVLSTLFVSFGYPTLAVLLPALFRTNVIWKGSGGARSAEEERENVRRKVQFIVTYDCLLGLVQKVLILRSSDWTFYIISEIGTHLFDMSRRFMMARICIKRMRNREEQVRPAEEVKEIRRLEYDRAVNATLIQVVIDEEEEEVFRSLRMQNANGGAEGDKGLPLYLEDGAEKRCEVKEMRNSTSSLSPDMKPFAIDRSGAGRCSSRADEHEAKEENVSWTKPRNVIRSDSSDRSSDVMLGDDGDEDEVFDKDIIDDVISSPRASKRFPQTPPARARQSSTTQSIASSHRQPRRMPTTSTAPSIASQRLHSSKLLARTTSVMSKVSTASKRIQAIQKTIVEKTNEGFQSNLPPQRLFAIENLSLTVSGWATRIAASVLVLLFQQPCSRGVLIDGNGIGSAVFGSNLMQGVSNLKVISVVYGTCDAGLGSMGVNVLEYLKPAPAGHEIHKLIYPERKTRVFSVKLMIRKCSEESCG
ncbi:hypothetical protein HDU97_006588 [Phlyctochytrium planicorne]|nr:hypothetical protein HDU97_006588 [Phlyctochytrium planicorne]